MRARERRSSAFCDERWRRRKRPKLSGRLAAAKAQGRIARLLLDSAVDYAIHLIDVGGTVRSWNAGARRLTGYDADEIVGSHVSRFYTDHDVQAGVPAKLLETARSTGRYTSQSWRVRKDGSRFWASVVVDAVRDRAGNLTAFAMFTRDVTPQLPKLDEPHLEVSASTDELLAVASTAADISVRATAEQLGRTERQLRESNRLMSMAERLAHVGHWHLDVLTSEVVWSDEIRRIFGWPGSGAPPLDEAIDLYHPDDRGRVRRLLEHAIENGLPYSFEARIMHPAGMTRDVVCEAQIERSEHGQITGVFGVFQDISERKASEREREFLAKRVALATQAAGVGIWDWDITTGAIDWDPMMFGLYGLENRLEAPRYQDWAAAVHGADRSRAEASIAHSVATGEPWHDHFRIVWPTGEVRHIRAKAVVVCDKLGRPHRMIGANFDVTEVETLNEQLRGEQTRLRAERGRLLALTTQLEELSALQNAILINAALGIISTDVAGAITLFNPAAERMLGYGAPEMVGRPTLALFHDTADIVARAGGLRAELGRRVEPGFEVFVVEEREGAPEASEWTFVRKDGVAFPVLLSVSALRDADGHLVGYLGMFVDRTEARRSDDAVKSSRRFLQAVTDNIPSLIAYWDTELRCRFANAAYYDWFGKTTDELEGMHLGELLAPDVFAQNEPYIAGALRGDRQSFERDLAHTDGTTRHTWAHYLPDIVDGTVRGFYVLVSDVTEIKATELALAALNERLRARTLEAESAALSKSQFLANMSHEIRSPMNAILGMLQLLQTTPLSARQTDYATKAFTATQALLRLLDDILDFSKIEAAKLTFEHAPFDIALMMRDISTLISASLNEKPIELIFFLDEELPSYLVGDEFRLRQVILNLANNAIKFTDAGEIVIEVRRVSLETERCEIEFSVRDTGIGIAPDQLTTIFEGFAQGEASTTRRYGGTGLGLTISQRIVALMGGRLDVASVVGRGSRFHFTLAFAYSEDRAANTAPETDRARLQAARFLIVDDNPLSRQAFMEIVESIGWSGDVTGSGPAALELIRRRGDMLPYDVVYVDCTLPGEDVLQTCRSLRPLLRADAAIVIMGFAHRVGELSASARLTAERNAFDSVLVKPITASAFIDNFMHMRAGRQHADVSAVHSASTRRLSGLRILVIDDFAVNLQVAGELLAIEGADVELAEGARPAFETIARAPQRFDIVLVDIQMPEIDGYETTRRLRALPQMAGVAIVAMTANAMEADRKACLAAGMDDHVSKPFDLDRLIDTIRAYTARPLQSRRGPDRQPAAMSSSDVAEALDRLGDNRVLFASISRKFVARSMALIANVRESLRAGEIADATHALHQLKGFAAMVGSVAVAGMASDLETALERSGHVAKLADELARLEALIIEGNRTLLEAIAGMERSPEPEPSDPTSAIDAAGRSR